MNKLKRIQKKEALTNYEMATILSIPEKTYEDWLNGRRKPRLPSLALINFAVMIFENGSLTKDYLLEKTGSNAK